MGLALAVMELGSLFAVSSIMFLLAQPGTMVRQQLAAAVPQALVIVFCCLVTFYYNDLYDLRIVRSLSDALPRLAKSLVIAFALVAAASVAFPQQNITGGLFVALLLVTAALLLAVRAASYRLLQGRFLTTKVLILGAGPLARKIVQEIEAAPHFRYAVVGVIPESDGLVERLAKAIRERKPDGVVVALTERRECLPVRQLLGSCLAGIGIEDGIELYEHLTRKIAIDSLNPSQLFFSGQFHKPRLQILIRRAVSFVLAAVGLLLSAPLMALIALVIKIDSRGPVFFLQDRGGWKGRTFRLIKFRTMTELADSGAHSVWDRDVTSRVTPAGRWLRRLRLDELPQFLNILKGDMDLVGPRPEMAENVATMSEEIPHFALRMLVRPGVTGWAQVKNGYSVSRAEVVEKVRYDLYYIKHMSFWFDLRILADTVKIVLFSRGS